MTANDWLESLSPPILVVGNGMLKKRIPEERYQSVVRINNYDTSAWSGSKATHWVSSGYKNIMLRPMAQVLIPWSRAPHPRTIRYDLDFDKRVGVELEVIHLENDNHFLQWFPRALARWKFFPSVGFCFLSWLHSKRIKPDIVGFDGMITGHHCNPQHRHGHVYTRKQEAALIRCFMRRNLNDAKVC